jgi:hypothetical protein
MKGGVDALEQMEMKLMNKESEFIHNYGVNRGYQTSAQKVDRCLFLSSDAKQLYRNICHYAYGDRRGCFPSQATLRLELNWSRSLMSKVLSELIELGFITTSNRGASRTLCYHITELNLIPSLYHSEIIHELKPNDSVKVEEFDKLLDEYKGSELCAIVDKSGVPTQYVSEIKGWFEKRMGCDVAEKSILFSDKAPDGFIKRIEPKIAPSVDKILDPNSKPKSRGNHYSKKDIELWNNKDFCEYFKDKYNENHKLAYIGNSSEDVIYMKHVVSKRDKNIVKELIELYILKTDFSPKTVKHFSSSGVQQGLGVLHETGKMPEFKKKSDPKPSAQDFDSNFGF